MQRLGQLPKEKYLGWLWNYVRAGKVPTAAQLVKLLESTARALEEWPNVVELDLPKDHAFFMWGDTHGHKNSFKKIMEKTGVPGAARYLYSLGDVADREMETVARSRGRGTGAGVTERWPICGAA